MSHTLVDALRRRAQADPSRAAIVWRDAPIGSAHFDHLTTAGAAHLMDVGVGRGDRVLLSLPTGIELAVAYYACFKAGATAVPVPKGASAIEVGQLIEDCRPRVGLTSASAIRVQSPSIRWLTLDERWPARAGSTRLPAVGADDLAVILFTSGTTGRARGVMHTHRSILGWLNATDAVPQTRDTVVVAMPLVHSYGFVTFVSRLSLGARVVLLPEFDAGTVLDAIDRHSATTTIANPAMAHALVKEQSRMPRRLESLRRISVSGDMASLDLQERCRKVFGDRVCRTYGSTEVTPIAGEAAGAVAANSLGRCFPGVDVRILDEDGGVVAPGVVGEIVVRSPSMAVGYWRDRASTAAAFRGGYFHTGDLGSRDEHGQLYFAGRGKEIIVRAGLNISPRQIEDELRRHPAVADVAVSGLPDAVLGQSIAAWVVPRSEVSPGDLREFVRLRVADHKCPGDVFIVTALPRTATGKVNRRALGILP
jgi:long-chain acyl-CoA synthetase